MNLRTVMRKLQTALLQKGRTVCINQYQSYSQRAERVVTKFALVEKVLTDTGKKKNQTLLETYSMVEVTKKLAEMYGEYNEPDS